MFNYNDIVKLIKSNGKIIENIKAIAQPKTIFIQDEKVPIEENDIIEVKLPSGVIERKVVIDPGYHGKHSGFPAYQCKVKSVNQVSNSSNKVIYNINGNNAKVNINSLDQSTNNVTITPQEVFTQLENTIKTQIEDNQIILEMLEEMKQHQGKSTFTEKYQKFIANTANYMSIISPFIPALTQML